MSLFVKQIKVLQLSSPQDFETALFNIIYGFEQTASSFKSLVHDPELSIYVTPPASDVVYALSRDLEEEEKAKKIPWPDAELLFGQDPDYQNDVGQIFHQIKDEVENVLSYSRVSFFEETGVNKHLFLLADLLYHQVAWYLKDMPESSPSNRRVFPDEYYLINLGWAWHSRGMSNLAYFYRTYFSSLA